MGFGGGGVSGQQQAANVESMERQRDISLADPGVVQGILNSLTESLQALGWTPPASELHTPGLTPTDTGQSQDSIAPSVDASSAPYSKEHVDWGQRQPGEWGSGGYYG